jgi:predicted methyltransferase
MAPDAGPGRVLDLTVRPNCRLPAGVLARLVRSQPCATVARLFAGVLAITQAGAARAEDVAAEARAIIEALSLRAGASIADVGAGDGDYTIPLARTVGPTGQVYATEIKKDLLAKLRKAAKQAGLKNVTTVLGGNQTTGLGPESCDAILLRKVYHHFVAPQAMNESLWRALKPGGLLAVIDYTTFMSERVEGVPENRDGHGLAPEILIEETTAAGFELVTTIRPWMDEANVYCVLLRRPS